MMGDKILIIGLPCSGKTTLFNMLKPQLEGYTHTQLDDYTQYGWQQSLYILIEDLEKKPGTKILMEGVLGYRFLRKIEELHLSMLRPDLIIICETDRPPLPKHLQINHVLRKIWGDYTRIRTVKVEEIKYRT